MKEITTTKMFFFLLFCLSLVRANAQEQNSLDFDGIDDQVLVPNASAAIANGVAISMSMWVYPTNVAPVFPDYDGFAGFRNNSSADFYLVQIDSTKLEARFRNSNGVNFDIVDSLMPVNVWVHYVLTYSGSELTLYRNGSIVSSRNATGTIGSATETFYIGNLIYLTYDFRMTGRVDEVALWGRALSGNEVSCIAGESVNPGDPGLVLYYDFNQGTANGTNTSISTLTDLSGSLNGTLSNFGMTGGLSNFVQGVPNFSPLSQTICPGDSYLLGGQTFSFAGTYNVYFPISTACDSVTNLVLSVVDTSITELFADGITLSSNQAGAQYAWADCNNGYALIPGEISSMFTPTVPGDYALILTMNGCTDTTVCHNVMYVGLSSIQSTSFLSLSQNPFHDELSISVYRAGTSIKVSDIGGRLLYDGEAKNSGQVSIGAEKWTPGIYFIRAVSDRGVFTGRVVKQ